ncbi:MAG: hypothetical protein DMF57_10935 [Acidobacteria bacterium]|nr:MAG: hypothetical protein DMF57_10935 [Acidobacteriota bacterium]
MINVRASFPALQRTHNGRPVAYFDAPGGTQVPRGVAEAMSDYLFHHNAARRPTRSSPARAWRRGSS